MEQVKNNSIIFSNTQQNLKLPFKMSTLGSDSLANWDLTPYLPPPPSWLSHQTDSSMTYNKYYSRKICCPPPTKYYAYLFIALHLVDSWTLLGKTRLFRVQNAGIKEELSKRVGGQCEIWGTLFLNEVIAIYLSILFIWFLGAQRLFLQISKIPLPSQCDIWSACLECTPGWSHNYRNAILIVIICK